MSALRTFNKGRWAEMDGETTAKDMMGCIPFIFIISKFLRPIFKYHPRE